MTIPCSQESKPRCREGLEQAAITGSAGASLGRNVSLFYLLPPEELLTTFWGIRFMLTKDMSSYQNA